MKKITLVVLTIFLFANVFAQRLPDHNKIRNFITVNASKSATAKNYYKTTVSDWYMPLSFAWKDSVIGSSLQLSLGFLQHDSLAKIVYADETVDHNSWLSAGRVLDPKDTLISYTDNPGLRLSQYNSYTLDSVRFTYAYIRNQDTFPDGSDIVDTLFISYFQGNEIHKYSMNAGQSRYAVVDWSGDSIRMPLNFFKMDTVLLTKNDSTGIANTDGKFENYFNTRSYAHKAPSGLAVNANGGYNTDNLVAYTFTFKSAIPTVVGSDTAIMIYQKNPSTLPSGARRTNYFGFYYAQDTTSWSNPEYYNTSLLAPWWCAYLPADNWYGYVPGNAYTHDYFIDADFHLTSSANVDVKEIKNNNFAMSDIYPNPAKGSEGTFIAFNLKSASKVHAEIVTLLGQPVKTITNKSFDSGENRMDINLSGISAGIYFVNVSVNGFTQTKKLSIAE